MANPLISTMLNNLLDREGREKNISAVSSILSHSVRLSTKQESALKEIFLNHDCKNHGRKKVQDLPAVTFQSLNSLVSKEKSQINSVSKTTINLCSLEDLTPKR